MTTLDSFGDPSPTPQPSEVPGVVAIASKVRIRTFVILSDHKSMFRGSLASTYRALRIVGTRSPQEVFDLLTQLVKDGRTIITTLDEEQRSKFTNLTHFNFPYGVTDQWGRDAEPDEVIVCLDQTTDELTELRRS